MKYVTRIESPIGELTLVSNGNALIGLYMRREHYQQGSEGDWVPNADAEPFPEVRAQLAAYFAGQLESFTVPVELEGTAFQKRVWEELQNIPYGETISYGEQARRIGNEKACRAVGLANGRNPVSIIIPCHRVIGANGSLTGYGGGLERKIYLLNLEKRSSGSSLKPQQLVLNAPDSVPA